MYKKILLVGLALSMGLAGMAGAQELPRKKSVPKKMISAAELVKQIKGGQAVVVVDVREPEELQGPLGALPGVINVPLSQLEQMKNLIPRNQQVMVICRSGNRSLHAIKILQAQGYRNLTNVQGGMQAVRRLWSQESQNKGDNSLAR